jgi:aspartate 1-decarboxylase
VKSFINPFNSLKFAKILERMQIEILKSKVHRAVITEANLNYVGSLTLDEDLMDAANMIENEKIQVVNVNNGERIETYLIKGKRGSGVVCLNGPAARKGAEGDIVIIISYASMDFEEAKTFKPSIIFPKTGNKL